MGKIENEKRKIQKIFFIHILFLENIAKLVESISLEFRHPANSIEKLLLSKTIKSLI